MFTKKSYVYGYAMTSYGFPICQIPFETLERYSYIVIIIMYLVVEDQHYYVT